jgi:hypothetical protein
MIRVVIRDQGDQRVFGIWMVTHRVLRSSEHLDDISATDNAEVLLAKIQFLLFDREKTQSFGPWDQPVI